MLEKLGECTVNELIAGYLGDVAPDKLAVHADTLAGNLHHAHLLTGNLLKALLHEVNAMLLLIGADTATEEIVGVE